MAGTFVATQWLAFLGAALAFEGGCPRLLRITTATDGANDGTLDVAIDVGSG